MEEKRTTVDDFLIQVKLKELEDLYTKAREIAFNFIGPPMDEADDQMINEATPMQAILALENELNRQKILYYREFFKKNPTLTKISINTKD